MSLEPARLARCVLAGALLLWGGLSFTIEAHRAIRGREASPHLYPESWLLGGPQVEPLRASLEQLDPRLPEGATVAVDSQAWPPEQLHYLTMWTAYYLPRQRVIHREYLGLVERPLYLLSLPPRAASPPGAQAPPWTLGTGEREAPFSLYRLGAIDGPSR